MTQETSRQCPACYERVPEEAAACPHCRALYHPACLSTGCVVAGCKPRAPEALIPEKRAPSWKVRVLELTVVVMIIGVLAAIAVPNFKSPRHRHSPTRSCYANQKTIVGAIEMYNLDKNTKRTVLDAAFFEALKSGGYLQSIPRDPDFGPGSSSNYQTTDLNNGIKCVNHGMIQ